MHIKSNVVLPSQTQTAYVFFLVALSLETGKLTVRFISIESAPCTGSRWQSNFRCSQPFTDLCIVISSHVTKWCCKCFLRLFCLCLADFLLNVSFPKGYLPLIGVYCHFLNPVSFCSAFFDFFLFFFLTWKQFTRKIRFRLSRIFMFFVNFFFFSVLFISSLFFFFFIAVNVCSLFLFVLLRGGDFCFLLSLANSWILRFKYDLLSPNFLFLSRNVFFFCHLRFLNIKIKRMRHWICPESKFGKTQKQSPFCPEEVCFSV